MGLNATIKAGVTTAFSALGDLVETNTLQKPDTLADTTEAVTAGATGTWGLVEDQFNQMEIAAGDVQAGDVKVLGDDAGKPFSPAPGMTLTWRGLTYNIHAANPVQNALWQLHLKRPL